MGIAQTSKLFSLLLKVLADIGTEDVKCPSASLGFPTVRGVCVCVRPSSARVSILEGIYLPTFLLLSKLLLTYLQIQKKLLAVFFRSFPGSQRRGKFNQGKVNSREVKKKSLGSSII